MTASQRVMVNALATYGRSLVAMALGLFSSRWVLQALGVVDFGLLGVVGGLVVFVTFLNGVTSASCARFFAYSIGGGKEEETRHWFNTALSIHVCLPTLLVLVGWPLAEWAINGFLNIPPDRLQTARWVFRFSLLTTWGTMMLSPYQGMFLAKQNIVETSLWSLLLTILKFVFVYCLLYYHGDAWLLYGIVYSLLTLAIAVAQAIRARILFPECRIDCSAWFDWPKLRQICSYAGWQLFGALSSILRSSGINILLNKYFPPEHHPDVNASNNVGNQLGVATASLSLALIGAFTPEITTCEGANNRQRMLLQADRASKFSVLLMTLFAVPLFLEADGVLVLWLKTPPALAADFCRLFIITELCYEITCGHMLAVNASGRVALYQIVTGGVLLLGFPAAWLVLACGCGPLSVAVTGIFVAMAGSLCRIVFAHYLVGSSVLNWLKQVLLPCLLQIAGTALVGTCVIWLWPGFCFLRLCVVILVCSLVWVLLAGTVTLAPAERAAGWSVAGRFWSKIKGKV